MTQMKPCIDQTLPHFLISAELLRVYYQTFMCLRKPLQRERTAGPSYLVLLLKAVALRALHLGDVLEEVCHTDGRVQLSGLVRDVGLVPLPQGVRVRLDQAARVTAHVLALIWGTWRREDQKPGQDG